MITLRPYQFRAVEALLANPRGILKSPAGSGKTLIGAAALAQWIDTFQPGPLLARLGGPRVVWIAPTVETCDQARNAMKNFPQIGQKCRLEVACYASIPDCRGAAMVILDEMHRVAAPEYRKCLDGFTGWRWGLSATPERSDDLAPDVYTLIGPVVCTIDRKELIASGNLAEARVIFHKPNLPMEFQGQIMREAEPLIHLRERIWCRVSAEDIRRRTIWAICQKIAVFENFKRNEKIIALAHEHAAASTIILVGTVEHGKALAARIPGAVVAHSKMGVKARRDTMAAFRAGELRCMIGTSLLDEGFDAPCTAVMIITSGGRSSRKAEQTTGRALRPFAGKEFGLIHDFWDHQFTFNLAQSKARRKVYASLGYEIFDDAIDGETLPGVICANARLARPGVH